MKYKCIIFDLDGTLLDSLQGILNAINLSFKELGYNITKTYEEGKTFIGAGAIEFARRAIRGSGIPFEKEKDIMDSFLKNYAITQSRDTLPYEKVPELLKSLQKHGYLVCVASNKPQILLEPILEQLFPNFKFDMALGQRPNKPIKPDPFVIFEIMNQFNLRSDDCLYIGDSEYDYKTAHNAGIDVLITKYGYGFYDQPWMKKVKLTVDSVAQLKDFLL